MSGGQGKLDRRLESIEASLVSFAGVLSRLDSALPKLLQMETAVTDLSIAFNHSMVYFESQLKSFAESNDVLIQKLAGSVDDGGQFDPALDPAKRKVSQLKELFEKPKALPSTAASAQTLQVLQVDAQVQAVALMVSSFSQADVGLLSDPETLIEPSGVDALMTASDSALTLGTSPDAVSTEEKGGAATTRADSVARHGDVDDDGGEVDAIKLLEGSTSYLEVCVSCCKLSVNVTRAREILGIIQEFRYYLRRYDFNVLLISQFAAAVDACVSSTTDIQRMELAAMQQVRASWNAIWCDEGSWRSR